jgi:hypothetical protein
MSQDFFKEVWEVIHTDILEIMQEVHTTNAITKTQTHGMMVCIPKKQVPIRPEDYRILTLLNAAGPHNIKPFRSMVTLGNTPRPILWY